jgi:hypothetical protein
MQLQAIRSVRAPEREVQLDGSQFLGPAAGQDRRAAGGEAHHPAVVVEEDGPLAAVGVDNEIGEGGRGVGLDVGGSEWDRLHRGAIGTNRPGLKLELSGSGAGGTLGFPGP